MSRLTHIDHNNKARKKSSYHKKTNWPRVAALPAGEVCQSLWIGLKHYVRGIFTVATKVAVN